MNVLKSYTPHEAAAAGFLNAHETARVADGVRIIPYEDDGRHWGPVTIGAGALVREGVIICSGASIGDETILGHNVVIRRGAQIGPLCVLSHGVVI